MDGVRLVRSEAPRCHPKDPLRPSKHEHRVPAMTHVTGRAARRLQQFLMRPYPKIINKAASSTRTTSKTDQGTKNQLSRLMGQWLSPIDQDQLDLSQRAAAFPRLTTYGITHDYGIGVHVRQSGPAPGSTSPSS